MSAPPKQTVPQSLPKTQADWRKALDALPSTPEKIPAFFFGHGSPMLAHPEDFSPSSARSAIFKSNGPNGPLANFLRDFGPTLLDKYKPKGILVFSAHWETQGGLLVTDYGDQNPLLMDYYGFSQELYELEFQSRGNADLSRRIVELFNKAGLPARTSPKSEPRGEDGRGFSGPGLDHGVFVPFRLMFGERFMDVPIVAASIDGSLDPIKNWAVGEAVQQLREEGILILSGGLTVHNLRDFSCFSEETAGPLYKAFNQAILDAAVVDDNDARKQALVNLTKHAGFRAAHPREDHFVPIYVAAGAGGTGSLHVLSALYGAQTFAFGL